MSAFSIPCASPGRPCGSFPDPRATFASPQRRAPVRASLSWFPASVFPSAPILQRDGAAACGDSSILLELLAVNCRLLAGLSPLECAVPSKHRVLPGFDRNCPSVSPLECAVTQIDAVTSLECALTKKGGRCEPPRSQSIA